MSARPEELLAAYADDGLEPEERAAIERLLAEDPSRLGELDELHALVGRLRAHARAERAGTEPSWDDMAAGIRQACDRAEDARARRWPARLAARMRRLLAPRPALGLGAAVLAAAVLLLLLRGQGAAPGPAATDQHAPPRVAQVQTSEPDQRPTPHSVAPGAQDTGLDPVTDLDDLLLDMLLDDLQAALMEQPAESHAAVRAGVGLDDMDEDGDRELLENAEWLAEDTALVTGFGLDALAEPAYEDWLDDGSEATLEELLAQAG